MPPRVAACLEPVAACSRLAASLCLLSPVVACIVLVAACLLSCAAASLAVLLLVRLCRCLLSACLCCCAACLLRCAAASLAVLLRSQKEETEKESQRRQHLCLAQQHGPAGPVLISMGRSNMVRCLPAEVSEWPSTPRAWEDPRCPGTAIWDLPTP